MSDYCEVVNVIPQYLGTCWFNAILMSCLYSQGASNVFRETILKDGWEVSEDPLKIALFNILSYINRIRLFPSLREETKISFQEYLDKVRPEHLILKLLEEDKYLFEYLKEKNKTRKEIFLGFLTFYIQAFLEILKINYLSIFIDENNNQYIRGNKKNPEIIILQDFKLLEYKPFKEHTYTNINTLKINPDYEELELDGIKYKLDSCLLSNYNNYSHAITGITCGDKRYVYNGWYNKNKKSFCPLIQFDWSIVKDTEFCLSSEECSLIDVDVKKLCFSFNKGKRRLLVYTKKEKEKTRLKTKIKGFKLNIGEIKREINSKDNDKISSVVDIKSIKSIIRVNQLKPLKPLKIKDCMINDIYMYLDNNELIKDFFSSSNIEIETLKDIFKNLVGYETDEKAKIIDFIIELLKTDEIFTKEFLKKLQYKSLINIYEEIPDFFKSCNKK